MSCKLILVTIRLTGAIRPLCRIRWFPDTILICTVVVFTWSFWKAITFCTLQSAVNSHFIWCACKITIHRLKRDFTGRTYKKYKVSYIDECSEWAHRKTVLIGLPEVPSISMILPLLKSVEVLLITSTKTRSGYC